MKLEGRKFYIWIAAIIGIACFIYRPLVHYDFINWDDVSYVYENDLITEFSWESIKTIFLTPNITGNYQPVVYISYLVDYYFAEYDPGFYHGMNLFFHLCNIFLLAVLVKKLTKKTLIGITVAAIFAVHPMHLEPIAWISSRKDLLYVFFLLISLMVYLRYIETKRIGVYVLCLFLFLLSCLTKGAAVVLTPILLLVDYYKLGKVSKSNFLNKIPFLAISLFFGLLLIYTQNQSTALADMDKVSILDSIVYAGYSTGTYIYKLFVPINLSIAYPYPLNEGPTNWYILVSIFTFSLSALGLYKLRKNALFVFGFLFFLFSIFPVSQIIPVGSAIVAERYSYFSYIGLYLALSSFMFPYFIKGSKERKLFIMLSFFAVISLFAIQTNKQVSSWQNSVTVWSNAIESDPENYFAYSKRGTFNALNNKVDLAFEDFNKALKIYPYDKLALTNRGDIYTSRGEYALALKDLELAIRVDSTFIYAHLNLGNTYLSIKEYQLAKKSFLNCLKIDENYFLPYINLGVIEEQAGNFEGAFQHYKKAETLNPTSWVPYKYTASLAYKLGKQNIAKSAILKARSLNPKHEGIESLYIIIIN